MVAIRNLVPEHKTIVTAMTVERQIGDTPLIAFSHMTAHLPDDVQIYAKAEWLNPGGSIKDRAAHNIILEGERSGALTHDKTILDSTSGNTGIAYAMLGAARGYKVKLFIPQNASPERIAILRAYGAELVFTDPMEGTDGAMVEVQQLYAAEPERYFYADQYNNPANWRAHYYHTGVEIWRQTDGGITHFIAGLGTSGTFTGTGRRLHEYNPEIELIAVQPDAPLHGLEGLKHMETAIKPGIFDESLVDRYLTVSTEVTYETARRLGREEGYLVGVSSAAAMTGALRVAEELAASGQPGIIVTVFPDNAYKYLSESFWQE